jgi:hypothetical protein
MLLETAQTDRVVDENPLHCLRSRGDEVAARVPCC